MLLLYSQRKTVEDWNRLQQKIGISFSDTSLLTQTFTHSSYVNENPDIAPGDNERLEFLGDAILNVVVTEKLYHQFPEMKEGDLTRIRAELIREENLARVAAELGLGEYLLLGKGELQTGGRERSTNLADTTEALIGTIFLDRGMEAARDFVLDRIVGRPELIEELCEVNYKARLQEYTQAEYKKLPEYRIVEVSGPDHEKLFTTHVLLDGELLGTGTGKSKKSAEMEAARVACRRLSIAT